MNQDTNLGNEKIEVSKEPISNLADFVVDSIIYEILEDVSNVSDSIVAETYVNTQYIKTNKVFFDLCLQLNISRPKWEALDGSKREGLRLTAKSIFDTITEVKASKDGGELEKQAFILKSKILMFLNNDIEYSSAS